MSGDKKIERNSNTKSGVIPYEEEEIEINESIRRMNITNRKKSSVLDLMNALDNDLQNQSNRRDEEEIKIDFELGEQMKDLEDNMSYSSMDESLKEGI